MAGGWVTGEDAVVVEVREKIPPESLRESGLQPIPEVIAGLPVHVRVAPVLTQLRALGFDPVGRVPEAPPGINYREPPDLELRTVNARMEAVFHVSPDSGFPQLQDLFSKVTKTLTATMYEWDADHVYDALRAAVEPAGRRLLMVTQPAKRGSRPPLDQYVNRLKDLLNERFEHTSAAVFAPVNLFATAYHIKVAVADREWVWLSSGNWKKSGQPAIDPAANGETSWRPLLDYNREWHALIRNSDLAGQFEDYIRYDYEQSREARELEEAPVEWPDLFVPLPDATRQPEAPRGRPTYRSPLRINRRLRITPLLTPDHEDFIDAVLALVRGAERSLLVQNQSFSYLDVNTFEKFEELFNLLVAKQRRGLDVRVVIRDAREFPGDAGEKQDELLERLSGKGFDPDRIKVQPGCHTKGIVVDGGKVLLGSHNFTNAGTHTNRDASLIVDDTEVARYFRDVFEFDWANLAEQRLPEAPPAIRLARADEATPVGMIRINASELFDSDFPSPSFFATRAKR
jgi:phosphatidylserine/phosphatidylglycerophosphate/cardiolipin synthase-like enzyme